MWPVSARLYVDKNICQWAAACDRGYYETRCLP